MKMPKTIFVLSLLAITLVFNDCKTASKTTSGEVLEIMPGLLQGYLPKEEIPNSLALIPPPPEEGSAAFALDQEYAKKAIESKDTGRFRQAFIDAELYFPAAVKSFESTLGIEISETKTPNLYVLMRKVLTDAALSDFRRILDHEIFTRQSLHSHPFDFNLNKFRCWCMTLICY